MIVPQPVIIVGPCTHPDSAIFVYDECYCCEICGAYFQTWRRIRARFGDMFTPQPAWSAPRAPGEHVPQRLWPQSRYVLPLGIRKHVDPAAKASQ